MINPDIPKVRFRLVATPECNVLVIESDDSVRERLAALLKKAGYGVFAAGSCEQAQEILGTEHCNIVLTGAQMPGIGGLALCREVRLKDVDQYTYLVLLTERGDKGDILTGFGAGADDCLSRSISDEELLARLEVGRRITRLEHSLRSSNEENRRLAETDSLTGAHNRRFLMKNLPRELERSRRYLHPLSVLSCDLDDFKRINDHFGHEVGDQVLQAFVERVSGCLRMSMDWIARSGGDEFLIVLPETTLSGARRVAEKVCQAVATPNIPTTSGSLSVTVSVGATSLESLQELTETSVIELLRGVDKCLNASKSLGRDRTTCAPIGLSASVQEATAEAKHEIN
jgi:two-component system, cell cycle response regulator